MSRYIVTLDFPNDRLYLKPGMRFAEPVKRGRTGLTLSRSDGKTRVKMIRQDTAADKAGLRVGDVIMRFDGRDAASLTLFEMNSTLVTVGQVVRLDVEGPDGRRQVEIRVSGPVVD